MSVWAFWNTSLEVGGVPGGGTGWWGITGSGTWWGGTGWWGIPGSGYTLYRYPGLGVGLVLCRAKALDQASQRRLALCRAKALGQAQSVSATPSRSKAARFHSRGSDPDSPQAGSRDLSRSEE